VPALHPAQRAVAGAYPLRLHELLKTGIDTRPLLGVDAMWWPDDLRVLDKSV